MLIRTEVPADILTIDKLLKRAFETPAEAGLVQSLRENSKLTLSLVACDDEGEVVGHILFSPVTVAGKDLGWQGLAPLAVAPEHQGQGIGRRLIREGLITLEELGYPVAVTLGNPECYASSGFETAAKRGLDCAWDVPEEAFMVCELMSDALDGHHGRIEYSAEFSAL
ncbi:GNAT family N-acetyltransferase [Thaumasiovibrio subtropicus]|uniref:GNAT family N-acetyltransferase n=1 Tax=Thaumasiovibrio subtropicus TaxID=1891207 RepID=UPI000B3586A0|nr:N-acetyltransferase [Thaumasiovibrio subtropicus]